MKKILLTLSASLITLLSANAGTINLAGEPYTNTISAPDLITFSVFTGVVGGTNAYKTFTIAATNLAAKLNAIGGPFIPTVNGNATNLAVYGVLYFDTALGVTIISADPAGILHMNNGSGSWTLGADGSIVVSGSGTIGGNIVVDGLVNDTGASSSADFNNHLLINGGQTSVNWQQQTLDDPNGNPTVDWQNFWLKTDNGGITVDWNFQHLKDSGSTVSVDWGGRDLFDDVGTASVLWQPRILEDSSGNQSVDWENRHLIGTDGSTVLLDWSGPSLAGVGFPVTRAGSTNILAGSSSQHILFSSAMPDTNYVVTFSWAQSVNSGYEPNWANKTTTGVDAEYPVISGNGELDFLAVEKQ